ncbi:MAG: ECF transporter S component [Tyzzerella sp.]|nr:ECF transporter S component [Tyzzerella sp.]
MQTKKTLKLVMAALLAAMTCVATMVIKIPLTATGGYINLGDCIVLLSGILLGPLYGGLAAGIGSALADLFSGYVAFLPATFLIKGFMAVIVGLLVKNLSKNNAVKTAIAGALAECFMIAGYFFFEAVVMGFGLGAAASIPGNAIQGIVGLILAMLLVSVFKTCNFPSLRKEQ